MELLALIFILWLIGCLFPSSGQSYGYSFREVCAFTACAALLVFLFFAYFYAMAGIFFACQWLGVHEGITFVLAFFGPITIPMIIASICNGVAERRRASAAS